MEVQFLNRIEVVVDTIEVNVENKGLVISYYGTFRRLVWQNALNWPSNYITVILTLIPFISNSIFVFSQELFCTCAGKIFHFDWSAFRQSRKAGLYRNQIMKKQWDHPFITQGKCSEKVTFRTRWYADVRMRIPLIPNENKWQMRIQ